jgi:hypothetical protein
MYTHRLRLGQPNGVYTHRRFEGHRQRRHELVVQQRRTQTLALLPFTEPAVNVLRDGSGNAAVPHSSNIKDEKEVIASVANGQGEQQAGQLQAQRSWQSPLLRQPASPQPAAEDVRIPDDMERNVSPEAGRCVIMSLLGGACAELRADIVWLSEPSQRRQVSVIGAPCEPWPHL